jgi:hypothetical protein
LVCIEAGESARAYASSCESSAPREGLRREGARSPAKPTHNTQQLLIHNQMRSHTHTEPTTHTSAPTHTQANTRSHAHTHTHTLTHSHTRSPDRNLGVREKRVGESREMPSEATAETIAPKEHRSDSTLALSTPRVNIKIQVTRSESPNGEVQIRSTGAFNREILYCLQSIRRTSR